MNNRCRAALLVWQNTACIIYLRLCTCTAVPPGPSQLPTLLALQSLEIRFGDVLRQFGGETMVDPTQTIAFGDECVHEILFPLSRRPRMYSVALLPDNRSSNT